MSDRENLYAGSSGLLPEIEVKLEKAGRRSPRSPQG